MKNNFVFKTKWDLSLVFDSLDKYEAEYEKVKSSISAFEKYKGTLTKDNAIECLLLNSNLSCRLESLYLYAYLNRDLDLRKAQFQAECEKITKLYSEFSALTSFIIPEISNFPIDALEEMLDNNTYQDYNFLIKEIIREKAHLLSAESEELLASLSSFTNDFRKIFAMFNNADLKFGKIKDKDGKMHDLNHATYINFLKNSDRVLRKNAYNKYFKAFSNYSNTLSSTYIASVKKDSTLAKLRNYGSAIERALFSDNVNPIVYENLLKAVNMSLPTLHNYVKIRKRELGLPTMYMYDMYLPLVEDLNNKIVYEDAFKLVCEALKPMGNAYGEILKKFIDTGWVDVYPKQGKRSGAYSSGSYKTPPYLLLNYDNDISDLFTLAHELGHSMHSYFANKKQPYEKASYPIFVAEVASTVNEVLVLKYLLKTAEEKERKYLLNYYLEMFKSTLFRQTMFAEFEYLAHNKYEKGMPLTGEMFCDEYLKLNKKYYGEHVISDKTISFEWSRIPHFYSAFYVYKYATGLTSAITIANKILESPDYVKSYIEFLSAGGSEYPVELLKGIGVDLETTIPYDIAMKEFEATLAEFEIL